MDIVFFNLIFPKISIPRVLAAIARIVTTLRLARRRVTFTGWLGY
ncbi:hypothetical protein BN938_1135 [Mucinivorans hirudinis]|uniref:Uncharacterized protein n=1 Tax=Mucinivorans hirudinis TaxID=1433126 RepID=A0A060R7J7_9BACT|nr:hypothetical protein BN938_1135 [Mucinivorans hirudinis]